MQFHQAVLDIFQLLIVFVITKALKNKSTLQHLACHFNQLLFSGDPIVQYHSKSSADLVISSSSLPIQITGSPDELLLSLIDHEFGLVRVQFE